MAPVDDVIDGALARLAPETRQLLRRGDAAWSASAPDIDAASDAWYDASSRIVDAFSDPHADASAVRVAHAAVLVRLCWLHLVRSERGVADLSYLNALASIAPLVEADARRYAPLRAWILAERGYVRCREGRLGESLRDLRDAAAILAARHASGDAGTEAQREALRASIEALRRRLAEPSA